jgi:hypothetical protein
MRRVGALTFPAERLRPAQCSCEIAYHRGVPKSARSARVGRPPLSPALSNAWITRLVKHADYDDLRFVCDEEECIRKTAEEDSTEGAMEESKSEWVLRGRSDGLINGRFELFSQFGGDVAVPGVCFTNVALGGAANNYFAAHSPQRTLDRFPGRTFARIPLVFL